ncbi:MAG TPA: YSC84-related protein [Caldimonas sp.]|nr:YSC84-related protein [Caldimonas sp.]
MRKALSGLIAVTALAVSVPALAANPDEEKAELRKMCDEALATLYKAKPEAKKLVETSPGYGCFSSFGLTFFVGGSGGQGLVYDKKTKKTTYMKMGAVSGGLDIGAKGYREVLVFKNEATLNEFVTSGWQLGASGTAVAAAGGKGAKGHATNVNSDIQVFPMTKNGLEAGISAETRKYWKDDDLNK